MALPRDTTWTRASVAELAGFIGLLAFVGVLEGVGVLPIRWAALLMLVVSAGAASVRIAGRPDAKKRSTLHATWARGMAAMVFCVAVGAAATALFPPEPIVAYEISGQGQRLALPPDLHGRVRVSLRARFDVPGDAMATIVVSGTEPLIEARFDSAGVHVKGAGGTHVRTRDDSRSFAVRIPDGVTWLDVQALDGYPAPSVRLSILPHTWDLAGAFAAAAFLSLLVIAIAASRIRMSELAVAAAAVTLCYGFFIRYSSEAGLTVKGLLAGLMGCVVVGGLGGWLLGRLVGTIAGQRSAAPPSRARGR